MNQELLIALLRRFWRLVLALAFLALGLLWAVFGLSKAVVIVCLALLGYYLGKWIDEGRPDGGVFRLLNRLFND
jgi:uncharacterized membrane protein